MRHALRNAILAAAFGGGMANSAGALAQASSCGALLQGMGSNPVVQYDAFRGAAASADLFIPVDVPAGSTCALGLAIFGASPGSDRFMAAGSSRIRYRLFSSSGVELTNDGNGSAALLPADRSGNGFKIRVEVPAGEIAPAGLYSDTVTVRLFDLSGAASQIGESSATVTAVIEARAQINLAGGSVSPPGGAFAYDRLDFDTLARGATRQAMVQVRSTAPVSIRISSDNKGVLLRSPALNGAALSYDLVLDGETLALSGGQSAILRSPPVQFARTSYPLEVRIVGDPDVLPAGEYEDLLTIDVTPN